MTARKHNIRILIVDDEPDVVMYLKTVLEQYGYETLSAESVEEGMAVASKHCPDLVCLDIMIPGESGISMYARLREHRECARVPVIIISGMVQEDGFDIASYVDNTSIPAPNGFLEKPIDVGEFVSMVRSLTGDTSDSTETANGYAGT